LSDKRLPRTSRNNRDVRLFNPVFADYNVAMHIFVKATGLELTNPLKAYIENKIGGLSRFLKRTDVDVVKVQVEVARLTRHHRQGKVYRAEANMELPQGLLRAEESDWDARVAVDAVKGKLQRKIKEYTSRHGREHRSSRKVSRLME
jgi:ribosomal subunit interface protein